jgi:hypothetical protein
MELECGMRDNAGGVATQRRLDDQGIVVLFPVGRRDIFVLQIVQTGPETHSASISFCARARSFLQGKSAGAVILAVCSLRHRLHSFPRLHFYIYIFWYCFFFFQFVFSSHKFHI